MTISMHIANRYRHYRPLERPRVLYRALEIKCLLSLGGRQKVVSPRSEQTSGDWLLCEVRSQDVCVAASYFDKVYSLHACFLFLLHCSLSFLFLLLISPPLSALRVSFS